MKKYFLYAVLLFAGTFVSCESEDSDEIDIAIPFYQNLSVEYNVTQNHTHVAANFNKQDSTGANIRLPDKGILFNGKVPDYLNLGIYFYRYSFSDLVDVTFTFTRSKDQVFVNRTSLSEATPIAIPESFTTVNGSGSTILTWDGAPIGANEYVQARLEYKNGVYDGMNTTEGANSITITFTNPTSVKEATLFLSRISKLPLQQSNGNAGGKIEVSYVQNKTVAIQ